MSWAWERLGKTDEYVKHTLYEVLKNPIKIFHL